MGVNEAEMLSIGSQSYIKKSFLNTLITTDLIGKIILSLLISN
jgi:hypothetical protein